MCRRALKRGYGGSFIREIHVVRRERESESAYVTHTHAHIYICTQNIHIARERKQRNAGAFSLYNACVINETNEAVLTRGERENSLNLIGRE